jgi:hypothetical protein
VTRVKQFIPSPSQWGIKTVYPSASERGYNYLLNDSDRKLEISMDNIEEREPSV